MASDGRTAPEDASALPGSACADEAFADLDLTEVGTRRRVAQEIENHEGQIRSGPVRPHALALLARCLTSAEAGWLGRCRALVERLSAEEDPEPGTGDGQPTG